MSSFTQLAVYFVGLIAIGFGKNCTDPGFDLSFRTNLQELHDVPLIFENVVPYWIKGTLIRNGVGRFELGKRKFEHAFDAFGKLTSWKFHGNGSVSFSTRFLQSDFYQASVEKEDIAPYLMFEGVIPDFNEAEKLLALTRGIDNMNVNIYGIYDEVANNTDYIAVSDFWKVYTFCPRNLTTFGHYTAKIPSRAKAVAKDVAFLSFLSTAHPMPEPETTNHLTFLSSVSIIPWVKSTISLIRIKSVQNRELVAKWSVDKVPYMHSFSVTQNYAIIFASPFYVNVAKMLKYAQPFKGLDWHADEKTNVYVIHVKTGKVSKLVTDNMFTMHHVNAFESDDGKITVDVSAYPSPEFVADLQVEILLDPVKRNQFDPHATLKRYVIDLTSEKIDLHYFKPPVHIPFASSLDMPVINELYRYSPKYCYVYGVVLNYNGHCLADTAIVKKNLCGDNSKDAYWAVDGHYPVEPIFIATPNATQEDDGILMVPILNGFNGTSYLAILDSNNMQLVNRANLPTLMPYSIHGRYFPDIV